MNQHLVLPALLTVGLLTSAVQAQITIQVRGVSVRVGNGVSVDVRPGTPVPSPMTAPAPAPAPSVQPPPGVPLEIVPPAPPIPLPGAPATRRPPTIQEFAAGFKPVAGKHEVVVLHPYTNCPVTVGFCLPEGCPTVQIKGCLRRAVQFDYGRKEIEIWFYRDGRVRVDN